MRHHDPDGDATRVNPLGAAIDRSSAPGVPVRPEPATDSTASVVPRDGGAGQRDTGYDTDPASVHDADAAPIAVHDLDAEPTTVIDPALMPVLAVAAVLDPTGDPDGVADGEDWELDRRHRDWAWVEQWREEGERPAWAPGITLAVFVAGLVAVAIIVLTNGLSDTAWLALVINLVIAAGMAPALWLSRDLPVFRFLAGGAAVGLLLGWAWVLLTPAPGDMAQPASVVAVVDSIPANPSDPD